MSSVRLLAWLGLVAVPLSGCAINPVPVSALPGPNKDPATFTKDETFCRTAAARTAYQTSAAPHATNVNVIWQDYFASYGQCESGRGNLVQPVPWAVAYQLYLGYGLPYPGFAPAFAPYPAPYGYP